jgi:hypothetical protein
VYCAVLVYAVILKALWFFFSQKYYFILQLLLLPGLVLYIYIGTTWYCGVVWCGNSTGMVGTGTVAVPVPGIVVDEKERIF